MKRAFLIVLALMLMPFARGEPVLDAMVGPVFSPLDELGRAGPAVALLSPDTLDGGNREDISGVTPSGFVASHIDGDYVFQRCHLIGAQLAPGTEVAENLITGTVSLNMERMLPLENAVARYIRETGEHVLYRVEPQFIGRELICRYVLIIVYSIESSGMRQSVRLSNDQQEVMIDYLNGGVYSPD